MKRNVRYLTYTAVLLTLCVVFQYLKFIPGIALLSIGPVGAAQLLTGSLVNLCLILAAWQVGAWSGVAISVLSAVIAYLQGFQAIPHMVPVVALGNIAIVVICWLMRHRQRLVGVVLGTVLKTAVLYVLLVYMVAPLFMVGKEAAVATMTVMFSWPQLVTGVIGGLLAIIIAPRLERAMKSQA